MKKLISLFLLLFASHASAIILEGSFSGEIYGSSDVTTYDGDNLFGGDTNGGQNGDAISGSLRIDTSLAPNPIPQPINTPPYDNNPYHEQLPVYYSTNGIPWITMSFTVNGFTFETKSAGNQIMGLKDDAEDRLFLYTLDQERRYDLNGDLIFEDTLLLQLDIWDTINFLNSTDIVQNISYIRNQSNPFPFALGQYFIRNHSKEDGQFVDYTRVSGSFRIDEFELHKVPNPAPLVLLAIGLAGIGLTRKTS